MDIPACSCLASSGDTLSFEAARYVWRVGGNHEFELPLKEGELYEKRLMTVVHAATKKNQAFAM